MHKLYRQPVYMYNHKLPRYMACFECNCFRLDKMTDDAGKHLCHRLHITITIKARPSGLWCKRYYDLTRNTESSKTFISTHDTTQAGNVNIKALSEAFRAGMT